MKNCKNCKYSRIEVGLIYVCGISQEEIARPSLMGGPRKCPCYEKDVVPKHKFKYPVKEDLKAYLKSQEEMETIFDEVRLR